MIVCICNNISDREIRQAVHLGIGNMVELREQLGVGNCCGKCHSCAKNILGKALEAAEQEQSHSPLTASFIAPA